jgi:1-acyl-sn-glycerol-3-phosphate acyltransferase
MGKIFTGIYEFFLKRKKLLAVLMTIVVIAMVYLTYGLRFTEDISAFVPVSNNQQYLKGLLSKLKNNDKLILIFSAADSTSKSTEKMIEVADEFVNSVEQDFKPKYIKQIAYNYADNLAEETFGIFYRNLPFYLDSSDYAAIDKQVSSQSSVDSVMSRNRRILVSPAGAFVKDFVLKDPFGFVRIGLRKLSLFSAGNNFAYFQDRLFSKDKRHLFVFLSTRFPASETRNNATFLNKLDQKISEFRNRNIKIQYFGAAAVAVGNAKQLKSDSLLTLGLALIILFLFFTLIFRNVKTIFLLLLPVVFGGLFSLSLIAVFKSEISTVAIGAASIILGIAINYSIHFFSHLRHETSVKQTIRDLASPMIIGSTTTVGAFLGLLFVKSPMLQDFGLLSALVMAGSVLFTLIVLPFFAKNKKHTLESSFLSSKIDSWSGYAFEKNKWLFPLIMMVTIVFIFLMPNVSFDNDMSKLNYVSKELKEAENTVNMSADSTQSALYAVAKGKTIDELLQHNETLNLQLQEFKDQHKISALTSCAGLFPSKYSQQKSLHRWYEFWNEPSHNTFVENVRKSATALKFSPLAFQGFYDLMNKNYSTIDHADRTKLYSLFAKDLTYQYGDTTYVINTLSVKKSVASEVKTEIAVVPQTFVIDRARMADDISGAVQNDFNLILLISSVLVFGFLLMLYGRIELALIAFLPMLISWIWILGLMTLFHIQFNIVSIIIATFIFGLGDDYSIFIVDGLLQEYKTGKKMLSSYKSAVFLSAFTTLVGVGVLIFAKHPAMKSIATLTIIGMFSVVLVSFTVAPTIFNFLIKSKNGVRKFPVTAYNFLYAVVFYSYFILGCFITGFLGLTLYKILPIGAKNRKNLYHYTLYAVCRSTMFIMYFTKKKYINVTQVAFKKPVMVIANHQSIIDIPLMLGLYPKLIMITNDAFYHSKFIGIIIRLGEFVKASEGYDVISTKLTKAIDYGYSVVVFPEGTRSKDGAVHRFHKGAFYLASELKLDILPVVCNGTGSYIAKGDFFGKKSLVTVKFLEKINHSDLSFGEEYSDRCKNIQKLFRSEFEKILHEFYNDPWIWHDLITRNFIYKDPITEWYTRIKLSIEKNNYRLYHRLIPTNADIMDIGCGYGYLPMTLGLLSSGRNVFGVDYDEEKIDTAACCAAKPENVSFAHADITEFEFSPKDVFIFSDVLHYLESAQQWRVLENCMSKVKPGGFIIIRDGNADLEKEHKKTKLTEFFSTHIGFNKTKDMQLHFLSASELTGFAEAHHATVEILDEGSFTSNMIFKITKIE